MRYLCTVFHSVCTSLFLPIVHKCSLFSTSLLTVVTYYLFDNSHFYRCEVILWLSFAFPWWLMMLSTLSSTCWPSICFFKVSFLLEFSFLIEFLFFCCCMSSSYILGVNPLSNIICRYFLSLSGWSFHFVGLCCAGF